MCRYLMLIYCITGLLAPITAQPVSVKIIPEPVEWKQGTGVLALTPASSISTSSDDPELGRLAAVLSASLSKATGWPMPVRAPGIQTRQVGAILLDINRQPETLIGTEGYRLIVSDASVTIRANRTAGIFYGIQTFLQLLPPGLLTGKPDSTLRLQIPQVEITDYPRFAWRGLMFDVSRHFFTKAEVREFINDMVRYKFNLLHWHLTDDEGWRIEIKSYPRLTSVGAWNVKREGTFGNFVPPTDDEPRDYGGFYTQDDIREIIRYAADRYVNILPEIDVPGHSLAAIAAYPELSCTPGADKYRVRSGEKIMNWYSGGFTALVDNTLCPANEKVYSFLDKVFAEVASLFPFEYIHMGGDECAKNFWEKSPQVRALMTKEKLKDMHEVQSYFVKRVSKILTAKGKKLIGWDEILEGGLPANATVMSWRGMKGGIEAAKKGHEVVMTPTTYGYLDYMQGDRAIEPPVYATLRLKKVYEFEPVPEGVDPKLIRGGQANVWTEQIYNTRHLQYMIWPRGMAMAEALWSPRSRRNWQDFSSRVEHHFKRFDALGKKYAPSIYEPTVTVKKDAKDRLIVEMEKEIETVDLHYSFDNSFPDQYYPKYNGPITVPIDAATLKILPYKDGQQVGRLMVLNREDLKKRSEKK